MSDLDAAIRERLAQIHDPCSVAAGRPTSLIDMGMVLGWRLEPEGVLHVTFCVTFAGCTMAPHFMQAAAQSLSMAPGVTRVETDVDTEFEWTPERIRAATPAMRGTPQEWRTRAARSAS